MLEQSQREKELLEFQGKELSEAELQEGEEESLDEERASSTMRKIFLKPPISFMSNSTAGVSQMPPFWTF